MAGPTLEEDLALALELADLAADVALPRFRRDFAITEKPDGSIVTEVDVEVERRLLQVLAEQRPSDAVLSEECGSLGSGSRRWILDPIDGTSWFAHGRTSWGTHVALEVSGEIVLGVVTRPVSGERIAAARGGGAFQGRLKSPEPGLRLSVSEQRDLPRLRVMVWERGSVLNERLRKRGQWVEPTLDGTLDVARGRIDVLFDTLGHPWDLAPALPIVEEAGGRFVDHDGGRRWDQGGGVFTNGVSLPSDFLSS
jgi:histidinol-phosphatase